MSAPTMNTVRNLIEGWNETGTNSKKSPRFQDFVRKFKSAFTKELKSIGATNIVVGQGHYYLSGFFTVGTQAYYFNVGDIRWMFPMDMGRIKYPLLYRTAEHYKDWTGGTNMYVPIETGMAQQMKVK